MPAHITVDVCVVGGGPAGSVAAMLLARWGWQVALIDRRPTTPALAESLPPSTRKLLAHVGLDAEAAETSFLPNTGNTSAWGGRERRTDAPAPAGFHVARDAWDRMLLGAARRSGVRVADGRVRGIDDGGDPRVHAVGSDGSARSVDARYVLDCSGRTGILARRGLRRPMSGYRTVAIAAVWHAPEWPAGERTHTVIESYADGWSWSVPVSDTTRHCTVMIDSLRVARTPIEEAYARELRKTAGLGRRLAGGRRMSPAWACDASLYDCRRAADGRVLLVGDAASFVEPLSSAGVKKAMLSAWRAAVVVNTCLRDGSRARIALEYHSERERHVFDACAMHAAQFFGEAADAYANPFWTRRHAFKPSSTTAAADEDGDHLLAEPDVANAFDRLRRSTSARVQVSPALRLGAAPTIEQNEVVMREAVTLQGVANPIRFASNVDLPALVAIVARHGRVATALDAYRSEVNPIAPSDVLRGLSLLVARRAILEEAVRS